MLDNLILVWTYPHTHTQQQAFLEFHNKKKHNLYLCSALTPELCVRLEKGDHYGSCRDDVLP